MVLFWNPNTHTLLQLIHAKKLPEVIKQREEKHGVQPPKLMRQLLTIPFLSVSMLQIGNYILKVSSVTVLTPQLTMLLWLLDMIKMETG